MWDKTEVSKIACVLLVFINGIGGQTKCGYHAPPEYKRIFDLPSDQQKEEFKKLPLDRQVEMYRYAMFREPPDLKYSDFMASNGNEAIPYLLQRLREEESDYFKARLIRVFYDMHQEYYNLQNENEVLTKLKLESMRIRDSLWREESERYIRTILGEPGVRQ